MKTHIIYWAIGLLMINTLSGQVKIGDNPQSIHPASILELESNTGALVISRVTTAEMNNIVPLDGAMVYNIEEDCLHYYNGTEWVNLCEDNRITFSTLALFNPTSRDSTVVITSEDTPDGINYNFEVNKITSENIANNTVLREDLSFGIIGQQQLQDGAVTNPKLDKANIPLSGFGIPTADVSMGNAARITNLVNPTAPQDAATMSYVDARADDDITGVIFTPATNQLTVNEGTTTFSADLSALEESADIATNTANITANTTAINDHIAADGDLSDTNEIQDLSLTGNNLALSDDPTAVPIDLGVYLDNTDAQDLNLTGNNLTLSGDPTPVAIDLSPYVNNDTNELQDLSLTGNNLALSDDPTAVPIDLGVYLDNTDAQDLNLTGNNLTLSGDPTPVAIDLSPYVNNDTNELQDLSLTGNNLALSDDPTAVPIDLGVYLDNTDAQDLNLTGNNLTLSGDPTPVAIDLSPYVNNDTNELQDLSLTGNNLALSDDPTAVPIDLGVYLDNTDAQDLNLTGNNLTLSGDPTPVAIDLSPYVNNDTNELQDLNLSAGNILTLSTPATPGNEADLSVLNETVSSGTGITVTPTPATQDFEVAVTNPVIAIGRIIGGAGAPVGATVTNNTGGSYTVNLSTTPTNYVVQLTVDNGTGPRTIQLTNQAAASFTVQIYNAGATSDSDWSFTVISF